MFSRVTKLALLVAFISLLQMVYCRDATQCDINIVDRQIKILKKKVIYLKRYLSLIDKENKKLASSINGTWKKLGDYVERSNKFIKGRQDWYSNSITRRFKSSYKQKYDFMAHYLNEDFKSTSVNAWKSIKSIRSQDQIFRKNMRQPLIKFRREYRTSKMVIDRAIVKFKVDLSNYGSRTKKEMEEIQSDLHLVSRQVQLQQFNEFEKTRSDGFTGIKQIRTNHVGGKNYYTNDHNGWSIAGIHDNPTFERSLGIGELVAVMNGIDFRTSENQYLLTKPVTNDRGFHKTEPIAFPEIPLEVAQLTNPADQIKEMKEWFRAFRDKDKSKRDFTDFFKPVLGYLEGSWTTDPVNESLAEEVGYTSYTGYQSYERVSYKPSTIMGFSSTNKPHYSTWNYRFSCHPLKTFLHPNKLKAIFDPVTQRRHNWRNTEHTYAANFDLAGLHWNGDRKVGEERSMFYTYLDGLMEEVPGLDNYGATIWATGFDGQIRSAHPKRNGQALNGAHYHRPYKLSSSDAMGVDTAQRGYSDRLYVALTTSSRVAGPKMEESTNDGMKTLHIKASYAIPLEIIYLNPLSKWNPYDIPHESDCLKVTGDGSKDSPLSASCPELNFHTPEAFFSNGDPSQCSDDGSEDTKYVQSPISFVPICMVGSGLRVLLPKIKGLGIYGLGEQIRQRYPIMQIHGEGSSVWKKINAIEDSINLSGEYKQEVVTYRTGESTHQHIPVHKHIVVITKAEKSSLISGKIPFIKKATEPDSVHRHIFTLKADASTSEIKIVSCDSGKNSSGELCFDGHKNVLVVIK